jgi:pimeloyl-ACP methyl ester carboxylesterase
VDIAQDKNRVVVTIDHAPPRGVTPAMLTWWYGHVLGTMELITGREFDYLSTFHRDEEDFGRLLGTKLPIPALAIAGELDNAHGIADMAREAASGVTTAVAPGGGHWTPEENLEFLVAEMLRFLGR